MNKKVKWVGILSTAERNHIGLIRVRQNNVNSEVLGFEIIDGNGEPYDLKNRKVLFCTYFDRFAPVEQYAEVIENGKIIYTMNEHDMQKPVRINFAYFKIMDDKDNLVDTTQNFSYDIMPSIESKCGDFGPYIIRLEEVLDAFNGVKDEAMKEMQQIIVNFNEQVIQQQQDFELWFESIREILESIDPGGILLSEVIGARGGYQTIEERLNNYDKILNLKTKQTVLYGEFLVNLKSSEKEIVISCKGDSMTFGYIAGGGQAVNTYPKQLENCLNEVYNNRLNILNRGKTGDTTVKAKLTWTSSDNSDLTIMAYGINDAMYGTGVYDFIDAYRFLIERELEWNSAVILMRPFKLKDDNEKINAYRNAVDGLGKEYGITVIDAEELMMNVSSDYWSDGWHYNEKGYKYIGSKLASLLIGNGPHDPNKIVSGRNLLTRTGVDNVVFSNGATQDTGSLFTPFETSSTGIIAKLTNGNNLYYSVYLETDSIICLPMFYLQPNSKLEVSLNFKEVQPQISMKSLIMENIGSWATPIKEVPENKIVFETKSDGLLHHNYPNEEDMKRLTISQKGWATISVKQIEGESDFLGLYFQEYANRDVVRIQHSTKYEKKIELLPQDKTIELDVNELISIFYQQDILNGNYYKEKPYKLTLYAWSSVVNEYIFTTGLSDSTAGQYFGEYKSTKLLDYRANTDVKITSVKKENGKIIFNLSDERLNIKYGYIAIVSTI